MATLNGPGALHGFVVPAYGRSPHLADCLASLQAQTLASPIVVTTSTPFEGLEALVGRFGATLEIHAPNAGIGRDWNAAIERARTPWVTIAHQDDVYLPDFAARTLALIARHPDIGLVATGYGELLEPGGALRRCRRCLLSSVLMELGFLGRSAVRTTRAKRRLLSFGCPIPCPSVSLDVARLQLRFREDLKVDLARKGWLQIRFDPCDVR